MNKAEIIDQAKELRRQDELEESQDLLLELLDDYPEDPVVLFEVGGSFDVMGEEPEAIPYYRQAIEAGLEGAELQECLLCLGSCLRITEEYAEAVDVLERAGERFPDNKSGQAFLALAYYSNEQYEQAVRLLLELLLMTTEDENILAYRDSLEYYKDNLNESWYD